MSNLRAVIKIKGVSYQLHMTDKAWDEILIHDSYSGNVELTLSPKKGGKKPQRRMIFNRATGEERIILGAWNRSKYIRSERNEKKNQPLPFNSIKKSLVLVRKVLEKYTVEDIVNYIRIYLKACAKGQHIWDGRNIGYQNITGLLRKLIVHHKTEESIWWLKERNVVQSTLKDDPRGGLAQELANNFARRFLSCRVYELDKGAMGKFLESADRFQKYFDKCNNNGRKIEKEKLIKVALDCLERNYTDKGQAVFIGHFCSETLWDVLLPQYVKKVIFL